MDFMLRGFLIWSAYPVFIDNLLDFLSVSVAFLVMSCCDLLLVWLILLKAVYIILLRVGDQLLFILGLRGGVYFYWFNPL